MWTIYSSSRTIVDWISTKGTRKGSIKIHIALLTYPHLGIWRKLTVTMHEIEAVARKIARARMIHHNAWYAHVIMARWQFNCLYLPQHCELFFSVVLSNSQFYFWCRHPVEWIQLFVPNKIKSNSWLQRTSSVWIA